MVIIGGRIDYSTHIPEFECENADCFENEYTKVLATSPTNSDIAHLMASLYREYGCKCVNHIDDMFLSVIWDKKEKSVYILSDITTSTLNMYYTENNGAFYFSTNLKQLLLESNIERSINLRAARAFIANGYVLGQETLLSGVFKLSFGNLILVKACAAKQIPCEFVFNKKEYREGKRTLLKTIRGSIEESFDGEKINMPLSGGFDSNIILDTALKSSSKQVAAFSIGSKTGKSELDSVKKIADINSERVELYTDLVDYDYFDKLTDIVWRLDGCVYESGVFLQYALAKLAASHGVGSLVCGESSDEVQSRYYYESMKRASSGSATMNEKLYLFADPFIGTNMIVLKKSSVMLNSYDIVGKYPFKNKKVVETAASVARLNGTCKKYYKKQCQKEFDSKILSVVKTTGGTTGINSVVTASDIEKIKSITSSNRLIEAIARDGGTVIRTSRTKKLRRKQIIGRAVAEIRDKGLRQGLAGLKKNQGSLSSATELKKLCVLIFCELYVSGKYDGDFTSREVPVSTRELLDILN